MENKKILEVKKKENKELILKFSEETTGEDTYRIILALINQIRIRQKGINNEEFIAEMNTMIKRDYPKYYKEIENNE